MCMPSDIVTANVRVVLFRFDFNPLVLFFFCRRVRPERRPHLESRGHQGGRVVAAEVRLRPGRCAAVLDKVVLRRPGVLQVRAQGIATDQGFPAVGYHHSRREYINAPKSFWNGDNAVRRTITVSGTYHG